MVNNTEKSWAHKKANDALFQYVVSKTSDVKWQSSKTPYIDENVRIPFQTLPVIILMCFTESTTVGVSGCLHSVERGLHELKSDHKLLFHRTAEESESKLWLLPSNLIHNFWRRTLISTIEVRITPVVWLIRGRCETTASLSNLNVSVLSHRG